MIYSLTVSYQRGLDNRHIQSPAGRGMNTTMKLIEIFFCLSIHFKTEFLPILLHFFLNEGFPKKSCKLLKAVIRCHKLSKDVKRCCKLSKADKGCQKMSKGVKRCQKML